MDRLLSEKAVLDAILGEPTDAHYPSWYAEKIKELPSAEPQTEINMAYMRGKIDGINYCTERLRKMRMEVDSD